MKIHSLAAVAICSLLLAGCSDESDETRATAPTAPAPAKEASTSTPSAAKPSPDHDNPAALASRGKTIYMSNCIACHNADPSQDGALGPAVSGSSVELLEARVVHGTYPDGYTPKRDSRAMVALPYLEPEIGALAAYLAQ
jgi:mono/diheme cytochrome c family protein